MVNCICGATLPNDVELGRHVRLFRCGSRTGLSLTDNSTTSNFLDVQEYETVDLPTFHNHGLLSENIRSFFERFNDRSVPLYGDEPNLTIPESQLSQPARELISFCCSRQLSMPDISNQYELILKCTSEEGESSSTRTKLLSQFPSSNDFSNYVHRFRRKRVAREGWKMAIINTENGENRTGAFRPIVPILKSIVSLAGGPSSVLQPQMKFHENLRLFSSPIDSNSMLQYAQSIPQGCKILALDLYADGTVLSASGAQSITTFRMRVTNVRGHSTKWHEVALAPTLLNTANISESKIALLRAELFQRFVSLLIEDIMHGSRDGIYINDTILFLRINTIVADWKQERVFYALKSSNSYSDCTHCLMKTRSNRNSNNIDDVIVNDPIHIQQTCGPPGQERNVECTVSCQLDIAKYRCFNDEISNYSEKRSYLSSQSAIEFPPALAAIYGLGTQPYRLYKTIGLDRLHAFDLGVVRYLPDNCFRLFRSVSYNKGAYSKAELVRCANQRIGEIPFVSRLNIFPFKTNENQIHAQMTGKLRREILPFLWIPLLGLRPETTPDNDGLLQTALELNKTQILLRGINLEFANSEMTEEKSDIFNPNAYSHVLYYRKQ